MQKLVQHSSIGVAFVLCKARIEVFPGRVAADRMQKRVSGFRITIGISSSISIAISNSIDISRGFWLAVETGFRV